jgi:hypothetical protein
MASLQTRLARLEGRCGSTLRQTVIACGICPQVGTDAPDTELLRSLTDEELDKVTAYCEQREPAGVVARIHAMSDEELEDFIQRTDEKKRR